MYPEKLNIVYIIEFWLWGIFTKKTRTEISRILACRMRRDLSYETHSGTKTKTVKVTFSRWFPGDADGGGDGAPTIFPSGQTPSP